ncbi:MAG: nitroreductase family protein [Chloroflexota bacterium]|nr:nitroreductase family protein [Chloroflexota bacterium]
MDYWETVEKRHSVRRFNMDHEVSPEIVERILHAAILAPSAGNCQPWHFFVVRHAKTKERLAEAAWGQRFLIEAPVVIVVCTEPARSSARYGPRGSGLYCLQDTAAATEHILLAATALGLGSCWVGAFDERAAAQALQLPDNLRPVALVPLGHPRRPTVRQTTRRQLDEVVTYI